jgi:pSer/pThr/pTyr-binding forkhead associated (FHA) protein
VILKNGVAVGILALGNRKDALAFKRAIDHGVNLAPVAGQLFDDDFQLSAWLDRQGVPPPLLNVRRAGDAAVRQAAYKQGETQFIRPETIGLKAVAVTPRNLRTEAVLVPMSSTQSGAGLAPLPEKRLSQTRVITIGRQPGVALYIDHPSVSRRHAEISYANGQYILRDLGSTNGTYVNDARLEAERTVALAQNDLIRFGKLVEFIFKVRTSSASISNPISQPGIALMEEMATGAMPALSAQSVPVLGQPVLQNDGALLLPGAVIPLAPSAVAALYGSPALVIVTQGRPEVYPLQEKQHLVLGRERNCDIVLADITISRAHAEIFSGPDGFYVHDLQSSNGVVVNSARIDEPYRLSHGDRVSFGSIQGYFIDLQSRVGVPDEAREARSGKLPLPAETIPVESLQACPHCGTLNTRSARLCAGCTGKLKL